MSDDAGDQPFSALDSALEALWQRLGRAARDRRAAWHTPVLATVGLDGTPQARVLVMREANRAGRLLRLHSDTRTGKVREIAAEPRVSLLLYDPGARLQLRLSGLARVETHGPIAERAWADANLFARRCYTAPLAPGAIADGPVSGLPPELEGREPTVEESLLGRDNFSVVLIAAERLEFLHLAVTGHRRGVFDWDGEGNRWSGRWLVP